MVNVKNFALGLRIRTILCARSDNLLLNQIGKGKMRTFWFVLVLCFFSYPASAQSGTQLNLMPMPSSVKPGAGVLPITASFSVENEGYREPRIDRAVQRFVGDLSQETGIPLRNEAANPANTTLVVHADHPETNKLPRFNKQRSRPPIWFLQSRLRCKNWSKPAQARG